jgi:trigger factor
MNLKMKVTVLKEEGLSKEYEVVIPAPTLDSEVENRLKQEASNLTLPGFRKGKVPMKVLKARYGRAVMGEVLEKTVNETNQKVFKDKDIKPAVQPRIEMDQEYDLGKDLKYTMKVDVLPAFEVMDVSKVKLTKEVAEASEADIEQSLERIAKQRKASEPVTTKRAAKKGDIAVIDFEGESGGEKHAGMQGEDYNLELGSGSFIPGFEEQVIGAKAGDEVEVKVTFPENYAMQKLAGQDATFKVTVKELRETKMPEIDDAFAGTLGFDDLKGLKEALKEQAQKEYDNVSRQKVKKQLLDILDENHKFEVPEGMIDMEYQAITQQLAQMNQTPSDDEEAEYKEIAERRVRLGVVLAEIGSKKNVEISQEDIQQAVIKEAQKYPGQEAQIFEYFKNNPQALESIKAPIYEEKVVDHLLESAAITEKKVSTEELLKDDEAEEQASKAKKKASGSAKSAMGGASKETKKKAPAKKTAEKKPAAKKAPAKKAASKAKK